MTRLRRNQYAGKIARREARRAARRRPDRPPTPPAYFTRAHWRRRLSWPTHKVIAAIAYPRIGWRRIAGKATA